MAMPFAEYKIEFSSMVRINLLRQKIQYAQSILINTLETVATIRVHEETVSNDLRLSSSTRTSFRAELNNISNDLRNFLTTAQKLLALSTDSRSIVRETLSTSFTFLTRHCPSTRISLAFTNKIWVIAIAFDWLRLLKPTQPSLGSWPRLRRGHIRIPGKYG